MVRCVRCRGRSFQAGFSVTGQGLDLDGGCAATAELGPSTVAPEPLTKLFGLDVACDISNNQEGKVN